MTEKMGGAEGTKLEGDFADMEKVSSIESNKIQIKSMKLKWKINVIFLNTLFSLKIGIHCLKYLSMISKRWKIVFDQSFNTQKKKSAKN